MAAAARAASNAAGGADASSSADGGAAASSAAAADAAAGGVAPDARGRGGEHGLARCERASPGRARTGALLAAVGRLPERLLAGGGPADVRRRGARRAVCFHARARAPVAGAPAAVRQGPLRRPRRPPPEPASARRGRPRGGSRGEAAAPGDEGGHEGAGRSRLRQGAVPARRRRAAQEAGPPSKRCAHPTRVRDARAKEDGLGG
mmetsp:Transcript_33198/g.72459  ORF Transcript_33198/g.72459 Transcript_33198/m.72459 type:complete len:205 (-) Transcript_33198:327-941(-)